MKPIKVLTRRARFVLATIVPVLCLLFSTYGNAQQVPSANKNVLILLADDLGWGDVGFHDGVAETPNLDRLASEGVQLNRFYAYPACSPARAAMLTGRFPHRYGIRGPVRGRDVGLPADEFLLPAAFQQSGYETSLIGKWHLGHPTQANMHPMERGFDHFYGFMDASVDYYEHVGARGAADWQRNGEMLAEEGYATDLLTDETVRRIRECEKGKSFCIVVAYNAPHTPFQAPEKLVAKYSELDSRQATYAAMIESMDTGIGKILSEIDEQGLRDETVVVFASDNGAARIGTNAPFHGQKRQVYEGGIRVPCVIRAPGVIKPNSSNDHVFAIHDLFPTLADAAGVDIDLSDKKPFDGMSLWDNLVNGKTSERQIVIAEADLALIGDQWKLIQTSQGEAELYDLQSDKQEQSNLANAKPAIAANMLQQLNLYQIAVSADLPWELDDGPTNLTPVMKNNGVKLASNELPIEGRSLAQAQLLGDVTYGALGDYRIESMGSGIQLLSNEDLNRDGEYAGEATIVFDNVNPENRWYRFFITAMAQDGFDVSKDDLYLKAEFFQDVGKDSLDFIKSRIYPQVERERKDLQDSGTNKNLGKGTWRTYSMDFRTPFAEVDALKLSVGFTGGRGKGKPSAFLVRTMNASPIATPSDYNRPIANSRDFPQPAVESLVHLGGRWYFDPKNGGKTLPKQFDHTNADQLLYKSDRFETPFADNMSSWLRAGYKDFAGNIVEQDKHKPYSVVINVTKEHIVMRSRNLPNHPTGTFPDRWRRLDGNPAYIQERADTWHLPIVPEVDPDHFAMTLHNENKALPGGAVGVATNGVVFFNPFDHIFESDAVWRLDRCCGHPSPQSQYHYHKYPVCVKTPWSDEGESHSSVIGFAFDGFPVYGPYEAAGLLAREDSQNPLNDFNLHEDPQRGPHYHVTPGKFPHIIGGFWGHLDMLNRPQRRARQ